MCSHKSVPERRVSRHSRITHVLGFVAHAAIFGRFREALPENCFFSLYLLGANWKKKIAHWEIQEFERVLRL